MNPLYEPLPKSVEVGGIPYPVKTDFRAVLKLIQEVRQTEEPEARLLLVLGIFKEMPQDIQGAVHAVTEFIAGVHADRNERAVESRHSAMNRTHRISSAISVIITALTC